MPSLSWGALGVHGKVHLSAWIGHTAREHRVLLGPPWTGLWERALRRGPSGSCTPAGAARRRPGWGERRAGSSAAAVRGAWQRTPRPRLRARASTRVHVACAHARACRACTCVRAQLNMCNPVTFSSGRGCVERHTTPSSGRAVTPRAVCGVGGGHRPRGPTPPTSPPPRAPRGDTGRVVPRRCHPEHARRPRSPESACDQRPQGPSAVS